MLKFCRKYICKPLKLIFNECILIGVSLSEKKKGNVVPVHKKTGRHCLEKYHPVLLLPICDKILECLKFNEMFPVFFVKNGLFSQNMSGFNPRSPDANQLLSVTHNI